MSSGPEAAAVGCSGTAEGWVEASSHAACLDHLGLLLHLLSLLRVAFSTTSARQLQPGAACSAVTAGALLPGRSGRLWRRRHEARKQAPCHPCGQAQQLLVLSLATQLAIRQDLQRRGSGALCVTFCYDHSEFQQRSCSTAGCDGHDRVLAIAVQQTQVAQQQQGSLPW